MLFIIFSNQFLMGFSDIPTKCPYDFVMTYQPFAKIGEEFRSTLNCVDAVVSLTVKAKSEDEMEKNIYQAVEWFQSSISYAPFSDSNQEK